MPSIALSNSASEADFQMSASRIFCEMNYITHRMSLAAKFQRVDPPTLRKSLMSLIWSETVKVRLEKLFRNL
jgi:hypothetical protein